MKKIQLVRVVLAGIAIMGVTVAHAEDYGSNMVYIGVGSVKSGDPLTSSATPISLGYLSISKAGTSVWGLDIAKEGTKLDSTWGRSKAVTQATSYNLLVGKNLTRDEHYRIDAALLIGFREKSASCPSSYLGYQCYADSEPKTEYGFNYGVVLAWAYKNILLGLRASQESKQISLGFRF